MPPEQKKYTSWFDDLTELIRKKQEESQALKKVQDSLERGGANDVTDSSSTDEEKIRSLIDENQSINNENN